MEATSTTSTENSFTNSTQWIFHAFALAWNLISTILELVFQAVFSHKGSSLNLQDFDPLQAIERPKVEEQSTTSCSVSTNEPIKSEQPSLSTEATTAVEEQIVTSEPKILSSSQSDKDEESSDDERLDRASEVATGKADGPVDGEKKKKRRRRGKKKKAVPAQDGDITATPASDSVPPTPEKKPAPKASSEKKPVPEKKQLEKRSSAPSKSPAPKSTRDSKEASPRKSPQKQGTPRKLFDDEISPPRKFSHSALRTSVEDSINAGIRPIRQPIGPNVKGNGFSEEYRRSRLANIAKANSEQFSSKNSTPAIAKALSV